MRLIPLSVSYRLGIKTLDEGRGVISTGDGTYQGQPGLAWSYGWLFTAAHRPLPSLSSWPRWVSIVPIHGPSQPSATTRPRSQHDARMHTKLAYEEPGPAAT